MARKIEDTGIKVGGSRKEKASAKTAKPIKKESLPAWLPKKVDVALQSSRSRYSISPKYRSYGDGEWAVFDYGLAGHTIVAGGLTTRDEAIQLLPNLFWDKVLSIRQTQDGTWGIFKRMRTARVLMPCKEGFYSKEEAIAYAGQHASELVTTRTLNPVLPKLKTIKREGPDYRGGRDITGKELCETFGLCGVEFGEWLPDNERQASLNCCYEAFADLASVLHVDRRSIGFGGLLAVAFGSRGVSNYLAHFEPLRFVFNLTRMKGAGLVAHEWFHAFDYYIGAKEKGISLDRQDPDLYNKTPSVAPMSGNYRKDCAFRDLIYALRYHDVEGEEAALILEKYLQSAYQCVMKYRKDFVGAVTAVYLRNPASEEELADVMGAFSNLESWTHDVNLFYKEYEPIERLYAKAMGWKSYKITRGNECSRLKDSVLRYITYSKQLREPNKRVLTRSTQFYQDARRIDLGRIKPYWSTDVEMAARAFGAYVEDCLEDDGFLSQFLVHSHKNEFYEDSKPYPEGEERKIFRKLFDRLFDEVSF